MTTTSNLIIVIGLMLIINIGLVSFQSGILEVNANATNTFELENSPYGSYIENDTLIADDSFLPETLDSDAEDTGNIFTDTFDTLKSWFKTTLAPFKFLSSALSQPYGFLRDIGFPIPLCLAIGVLWYLLALILIVSWLGGR